MTWVLFIVGITLTIVKVVVGDKAESPEYRKVKYDKIIRRIKEDSEAIHFTFEECTFTKLETIKKRRRKRLSKSTPLGVNKKRVQEEESNTKITCKKLDIKKEFVGTFPIDLETAKTKTLRNNGITVYVEKEDISTNFEEEE